jgi:hypothetical protein
VDRLSTNPTYGLPASEYEAVSGKPKPGRYTASWKCQEEPVPNPVMSKQLITALIPPKHPYYLQLWIYPVPYTLGRFSQFDPYGAS